MHSTAVNWLEKSARGNQRVLTASTAAYLSAGLRKVPIDSPSTIYELALGRRPEIAAFDHRIRQGYYDGLLLSASSLRLNPTFSALLPTLQEQYVVVGPPELAGAWPTGLSGYVIIERRAKRSVGRDVP